MLSIRTRIVAVGLSMVVASGLAVALKPTQRIANQAHSIDLETMFPKNFGEWKVDTTIVPVMVSADVQAKLDRIYSQTLARTYVNVRGDRVMLSVAYGADQSDSMQVHKPEVCYPAQGFEVVTTAIGRLATDFGDFPVKRLVARQGLRHEPITYWIVVGDRVATQSLEQKIAQLRYGFTGKVPDGMLVRVSSIDRDEAYGFASHESFVRSLLRALDPERRSRIVGRLGA